MLQPSVPPTLLAFGGTRPMPSSGTRVTVKILLVEDDEDDADLMRAALREGSLEVLVRWVQDGEEAVRYLRRQGEFAAAARPDLILLDLRLPRMDGKEVLAEIKEDPALRLIPVIVMTSSPREEDFSEAYDLHANCCVPKPSDQEEFAAAVRQIELFWLTVSQRPPAP